MERLNSRLITGSSRSGVEEEAGGGVLLNAIDFARGGAPFESLGEGEGMFEAVLLVEPVGEAAMFPGGDVVRTDARVAEFRKNCGDIGITIAAAKHFINMLPE